jgi:ribokinase
MVGCVGDDAEGDLFLRVLAQENIDGGYVRRDAELPTGRAHISVDAGANSTVVVASGANERVSLPSAVLEGADVLLAQLEVPLDAVTAAMAAARAADVVTILNCAPPKQLSEDLLADVDYLVANEVESASIGEVSYSGIAIVTAGERGISVLVPGRDARSLPALPVAAVDTTGAGDAFCGCLAAALAAGCTRIDALRRAIAAGAHAVTVAGTYRSLPFASDVDALLGQPVSDAQN